MTETCLRSIIGTRLTSAGGSFHVYDGNVSNEPLEIWCVFDDVISYRFAGTSDGWHLTVDTVGPENIDMQDAGAIDFRDISSTALFSRVLRQKVRAVWRIVSPAPEDMIGVRFDFESATIRILNWGDEMFIGSEFPPDAELDEILELPVQAGKA